MRPGPSIRYLLLIANAFVVLVPVFGVVFLRLWDTHLVRVAEEQLIAESVLLAAAWRNELAVERNGGQTGGAGVVVGSPIAPIEAVLDLNSGVLPPVALPTRFAESSDGPEWRAAARIKPMMDGATLANASDASILDAHGCVLVATEGNPGACFDQSPEVRGALAGRYAAVARRIDDNPAAPRTRARWPSSVRVITAMPVWSDGTVVGVLRMSQESSSPLEAVWTHRYTVLLGICLCGAFMVGVTHFFSRVISRPVCAITAVAEAVAHGEPPQRFTLDGVVPAEVHALSATLDRMTSQLTVRARYIADFAATVSHELKTPITSIRGATELLRDAWADMPEAQRQRFLHNIDTDAASMERLVTRLLQLARIQNAPEAAEAVTIPAFLAQIAERYHGQIVVDTALAPATIVINADHLEVAVRNLLDNAVRHGAGKPVEITAAAAGGRLVIRVRDHGPGISAGNRARVFDRFFTTERDHGGTGLGLSIVQAVAETRGGNVTFETGPDGTTFTLTV